MKFCPDCAASIHELAKKDHVGDEDSLRVAVSLAKQCRRCVALNLGCSTCDLEGRHGYCAPLRCYCGHPPCYAFASFTALKKPTNFDRLERTSQITEWEEREEGSSWIDRL